MEELDLRSVVEGYIKAFEERQVARCVDYFSEDAVIRFGPAAFGFGRFQGKEAIEKWHQERFGAEARILKIENIEVNGNKVTVRGVVTSRRLKAVRIPDLRGSGTLVFEQGKCKELQLGLTTGYRLHV